MITKGCVFGRLTAIQQSDTKKTDWVFQCSCGNLCTKRVYNVVYGATKSCGCLKREILMQQNTSHNRIYTKEYKSWCRILRRCFNKSSNNYKDYGGSGITCEFKTFDEFYADIGSYPKDGLRYSVDRIDNDVGYIKGNVRWATDNQQARNKGKAKNNTSGVTGVYFTTRKRRNYDTTYAVAKCILLDGRIQLRLFSTRKLGILPAFAEATRYRKKMLEMLNEQGAGYSIKHGK